MAITRDARVKTLDSVRELLVEASDKIWEIGEPLTADEQHLVTQVSIALQDLAIRVRKRMILLS